MSEKKRLGDYVNIRTGKLDANASSEDGQYPFFTCSQEPLKIDSYSYDCECILIAGNGDLNVKYYNGKFDAYQRTYILESKDNLTLDVKYLFHFMSVYIETLRHQSVGGVIKYIKMGNLTEAQIPLPPIPEQKRIADILDKAETLRAKRREAITLINSLTQSIYTSTFESGQKYTQVKLSQVCEFITKGTTPKATLIKEKAFEGAIPFLKVHHITDDGSINFFKKPTYVGKEVHEGFLARSKVFPNDILMNIVGPPLGKVGLVPANFPQWNVNQAIAIFRTKSNLRPLFLLAAIRDTNRMRDIISQAAGVRQLNISLEQCRNIEIPLPPIETQILFENRILALNNIFECSKNSLAKIEMLFESIQENAFSGDL